MSKRAIFFCSFFFFFHTNNANGMSHKTHTHIEIIEFIASMERGKQIGIETPQAVGILC